MYLFRDIADCGQYPQYVQEAVVVVLALDGSAGVAFWQLLEDFGGNELGAEEGCCCVVDGGLEGHCELLESSCSCQYDLGEMDVLEICN